MIHSFKDSGSQDIFNGENTKAARKACPETIWKVVGRKLDQLDSVESLEDLKIPPANRLEELKGNRLGQQGIRINDKYRFCFVWQDGEPQNVEIVDYH